MYNRTSKNLSLSLFCQIVKKMTGKKKDILNTKSGDEKIERRILI